MTRSGIGYDAHRFAPGRDLILGGVKIDHPFGLDGHSDADVLCHAIADAVLGAAAEPDIGHLFPNTDASIRGISSIEILRRVHETIGRKSMKIVNIDATLIAEQPKIAPHIAAMKAKIASALGLGPEDVGVKATTNEGMGFVGRKEGIAALAVACIERQ